jgi:preprotein translocase subunit SecE
MTHQVVVAKPKSSRFRFVGDIIAELKKVVWLTRREVTYLTFLVVVVTLAIGIMLGAFDFGFSNLVDKVFLGK